jgi:hypothetical protein
MAILALLCLAQLGAGDLKPKVTRAAVVAMQESFDKKLATVVPDDPFVVLGLTQGTYIAGYGAVFTTEINLAPAAGLTPFHQTISKDEVTRIHQKKVERLPKLRTVIEDMLMASAASLDGISPDEQIAVAVSLFCWHWEDTSGIPSQIVMRAPRKTLLAVQSGRANRSTLASAVEVEQF